MTTAEEIRQRLAGYNPEAARENEAKGSHDQNRKFAPPWYELFHFRATLQLDGIRPNQSGIDQVVFRIPDAEVYETNPKVTTYSDLQITLPKDPPGYPTDEANLMVESLQEHVPTATSLADFDGLDIELKLDYADHPWMKERDNRTNTNIVVNGVEVPKRCWFYKTVAVYNTKQEKAPATPQPESVQKLAEWCVGQAPEDITGPKMNAAIIRTLRLQGDNALVDLVSDGPDKFFTYAASIGLTVGTDGKFAIV